MAIQDFIGDSDSYERINFDFNNHPKGFIITHRFSYKNQYGGRVKETVSAICNNKGLILEILTD